MLNLHKVAISIWLFLFITSFVVSVPMSHVLKIHDANLPREKRDVSETTTISSKVSVYFFKHSNSFWFIYEL